MLCFGRQLRTQWQSCPRLPLGTLLCLTVACVAAARTWHVVTCPLDGCMRGEDRLLAQGTSFDSQLRGGGSSHGDFLPRLTRQSHTWWQPVLDMW